MSRPSRRPRDFGGPGYVWRRYDASAGMQERLGLHGPCAALAAVRTPRKSSGDSPPAAWTRPLGARPLLLCESTANLCLVPFAEPMGAMRQWRESAILRVVTSAPRCARPREPLPVHEAEQSRGSLLGVGDDQRPLWCSPPLPQASVSRSVAGAAEFPVTNGISTKHRTSPRYRAQHSIELGWMNILPCSKVVWVNSSRVFQASRFLC